MALIIVKCRAKQKKTIKEKARAEKGGVRKTCSLTIRVLYDLELHFPFFVAKLSAYFVLKNENKRQ